MHLQGFRFRVRVGRWLSTTSQAGPVMATFVVAKFDFDDSSEAMDVPNSEAVLGTIGGGGAGGVAGDGTVILGATNNGFKNKVYGQSGASVGLEQATLITNVGANPFGSPFFFESQEVYRIEVYPHRGGTLRHLFPRVICTNTSQEGQVSALQPVTLKFETDGPYELYLTGEVSAAANGTGLNRSAPA